jgi:hypothetical protein
MVCQAIKIGQDSRETVEWLLCLQRSFPYIRCTQIKVKVKFLIFDFDTPFVREFQDGQEYVCLEVF